MKQTYIITAALFLVLTGLRAQDKPAQSLGLSLGYGNLKKQDLIFSPFVHHDWSPMNVVLSYERSGKLEQRASIRFGQYYSHIGDLYEYQWEEITYSKLEHSFTEVNLDYSLGKRIGEKGPWSFILGGRFRNRFQIANYDYGSSAQFAYHVPIGLDAWFNLSFDPGSQHHLEANLNLPLFSYVARSPYMGQDGEYMERISVHGGVKIFFRHLGSGELQSWGTSQIADFDLRYQYALSDRWGLGASYRFSMNNQSLPRDYRSYEQLFLVDVTYKF